MSASAYKRGLIYLKDWGCKYIMTKAVVLNQRNIFCILYILCLLLDIFALIIAKSSPSVGYESSIYESTPIIFWVSIILSIICGVITIIYYIFSENLDQSKLWMGGLFLIILSYTMCLSLFIIRGYYMWCMNGDPSTHIRYVSQILTTGNVPTQLFYPALHIYTSQILLLSNINIVTLHKILPLFFGILYIPFIYLLSKSIFSDKNQIILSTIVGSTFVNGWYLNFIPNGLSNLYFPLLLFIILKINSVKDVRWEILALIMVFFYPIFHLIPTLALIIFISTLSLSNSILNKMSNTKVDTDKKFGFSGFKLTLLILLLIWGITWISSFYLWDYVIKNLYTLINEGGSTQITSLVKNINYANGYGYNVIELALKTNGGPLIYMLITIVSLPIFWRHKNNERLSNLFSLYGPLFFISLSIVIFYFSNVLFSPLRIVTYTTMICTPFVGFCLYYLISKIKVEPKRVYIISFIGLVFLLFIVWINGILTLYPSPYTLGTSYQTTVSEVDGTSWLFENKNLSLETTGMTIAPFRYGEFLLTDEQRMIQNLHENSPDYLKVPYHFGYDNNSLLSSHYNQSLYMGINERDKRIYVDVVPEVADIRWVPEDFEKLNDDMSLKKIYSSKKFEIFHINGSEKK